MLAAVMAFLVFTTPAGAQGPPVSAQGEILLTDVEATIVREAGGNRFEDRVIEGVTVAGPLAGTFVQTVSGVVHKSGRVVFSGTMTFTGEVADCGTGSITLGVSGRGLVGDHPTEFPATQAQVRVIDQAANTIAVTGQGTVSQVGPVLIYDISFVCHE